MPLISLASPTCPYCDSQDVFPVGVDTASKGRAKKNRVWECRACGKRFSDLTVKASERKRRIQG